jgi:hypothetical protein
MNQDTWPKNLSVDIRIIKLLSAKTYEDFPNALRELISNAFDADASEVSVTVDLEKDNIEISDDGNGMTPSDFDFFLRIAGQQRGKNISPVFKRKRIGQFGIGFLAIFPFGKTIRIISTARNSDIQFEATIPSEDFLSDNISPLDIEKIPIYGTTKSSESYRNQHKTLIQISGLSKLARMYFSESEDAEKDQKYVRNWQPQKKLKWWLEENLPLKYPQDSIYGDAFKAINLPSIKVFFNKVELFRNSPGTHILETKEWEYEGIKCIYCIATEWKSIQPFEERFLKQRLRNVGVGDRESFDVQTLGRTYSRAHWLTGEIHYLEGMNELISIDRQKFYDSPQHEAVKEYFVERLRYCANYLEDVDVARRNINKILKDSSGSEVGEKKEIISKNVSMLESRGFKVFSSEVSLKQIAGDPTPKDNNKPSVKIDVDRKTVEVFENHPDFLDTIVISGNNYTLRYTSWDFKQSDLLPAVRMSIDGVIEINTAYPLFGSKRYGDVFKKVLITLLLLANQSLSSTKLLMEFSHMLMDEFKEHY